MSNRKLKRNVAFDTQSAYNKYQCPIILWIMNHYSISEMQATTFYIQSGLARAFELKHKPSNNPNQIIVSEVGQTIGE